MIDDKYILIPSSYKDKITPNVLNLVQEILKASNELGLQGIALDHKLEIFCDSIQSYKSHGEFYIKAKIVDGKK